MTKPAIGELDWGTTLNTHLDTLQSKADLETDVAAKLGTAGALDTALGAQYSPLTVNGKAAVREGELIINAADYGVVGDDTVQNLTPLNDVITAASAFGGVAVYFPRPTGARYNFNQAFPNVSNVRITADDMTTILRWSDGSVLAPTTTLNRWIFENVGIENEGTASHLFNLGSTGGLVHSAFIRCELKPRVLSTSIVHLDGSGNFFNVHFEDCMLWRMPTHTVPAINLTCSTAGCNSVSFKGGQWHSQNCDTMPFFRAESAAAGSYIAGFTFQDILGEQNLGGLIHMYGASRATVLNVVDFDGSGTYTDDLFKFDVAPTGSLQSHGVSFDNSGTNGGATFDAGKVHLRIAGGVSHSVGRIVHAGTQYGTSSLPATGRTVRHGGGFARSVRTVTTSTAYTAGDDLIIGNGTAVTVTLPDPTALLTSGTLPPGREFNVKNIHANSLTVASAGTATIDGSATLALATNASARLITDGTNWFRF